LWLGIDVGHDRCLVVKRPHVGNRCLISLFVLGLILVNLEIGWGP
jgi:hypothetical protein